MKISRTAVAWCLKQRIAQTPRACAGRQGLLALAPGLLWWTASSAEMAAAFMELALLAALLNRHAFRPAVLPPPLRPLLCSAVSAREHVA